MKNRDAPAVKREAEEDGGARRPRKKPPSVPTLSRTARWLEHRQVCRHFTVHGRCQLGWFLGLFGHFRPLLRKLKPTAPYWRVSSERVLNSARLCLRTIQLHPRVHLDLPYPLRCAQTNIGSADLSSRRLKLMGSHALDAKLATLEHSGRRSAPLRSYVLGARHTATKRRARQRWRRSPRAGGAAGQSESDFAKCIVTTFLRSARSLLECSRVVAG